MPVKVRFFPDNGDDPIGLGQVEDSFHLGVAQRAQTAWPCARGGSLSGPSPSSRFVREGLAPKIVLLKAPADDLSGDIRSDQSESDAAALSSS